MADNDIFSADPVEMDLGFNDLVGEGKKYSDPDQLAKAYANIERHARTVEAENAAARARLDAAEAMKNNSNNSEAQRQDNQRQPDPAPSDPNPTPRPDVDFRSQIKEEIQALNEQSRAVKNIEDAARKMVDVYGTPAAANEAIRKRADELGVSADWLRDSASQSPNAFYATMGITAGGQNRSTPTPHNDFVNRDGNRDQKDFEYFDRLRKEDPKAYYLPANQKLMLEQAKKLGRDFYNR